MADSPKRIDYVLSDHAAKRVRERKIEEDWIQATLAEADRVLPDALDPSVRHALKRIADKDDRILRVVYNFTEDPIRIVSVHFDRRLKGKL